MKALFPHGVGAMMVGTLNEDSAHYSTILHKTHNPPIVSVKAKPWYDGKKDEENHNYPDSLCKDERGKVRVNIA